MPRLKVKVLGKPLCTDVVITAPRINLEAIISSLLYTVIKFPMLSTYKKTYRFYIISYILDRISPIQMQM